jgi:hypothetical protein
MRLNHIYCGILLESSKPTHRVCNDAMENVMFQEDSTNSLSSVVINSCLFYCTQKHIQHFKFHEEPDTTVPTGHLIAIPCPSEQEIECDSEVL